MFEDETILDAVGVVLIIVAVAAFAAGTLNGAPVPQLLESVSPLLFLGVAAISGVSGVLTLFRNR